MVPVQSLASAPPCAHTCHHCGEPIELHTPCVSHRIEPRWVYYHPTGDCLAAAEALAATVELKPVGYGNVRRDIDAYNDWLWCRTEERSFAPWELHG